MTTIHQKQSLEDTVSKEVRRWVQGGETTITLTAGYGPDLVWRVCEFEPRTNVLLMQYQFFENEHTGVMEKQERWSPPFGLKSLGRDEQSFESWVRSMLDSDGDHLEEFAEVFYQNEQEGILCRGYAEADVRAVSRDC